MRILVILLLAPYTICEKVNSTIPYDYIESVFGLPASPGLIQPETILADSALDTNEDSYTPSNAEYDRFDWTLTKRVAVTSNENFLISPLGLKLALAILMEAASGVTQTEISSVLGLDLDYGVVRSKFTTILNSLKANSTQYVLNLGSRIYVGSSVNTPQRFAAIAENYYDTQITQLDFNKPAVAANSINQWVSNVTQGRIPQLVNADDLDGVVALVLNTLFFKGTWRHQFLPNATRHRDFYSQVDDVKNIPFMHIKHKFYYKESTKYNAKILRMPYKGLKFAMYLVVPNSLTGLPAVFNDVSGLQAELYDLRQYLVDLSIPKFKFEYTSLLDGILKELGIRQAFEDSASFPGISRGKTADTPMKISKVLQRSGIEINEVGSVAYSATEITLENKFGEVEPNAVLVANKPFMFFIQDEITRQLLFTGRVSDPSLFDGAFKLA